MIVPKRVYVGDVSSYPSYVGIISSTINQYSMESKAFFFVAHLEDHPMVIIFRMVIGTVP